MYLIEDEALNKLLDGDFFIVLNMMNKTDMSMKDLYCFQFKYESYDGFRKFYNKKLKHLKGKVRFIDHDSFIGKIIKLLFKRI